MKLHQTFSYISDRAAGILVSVLLLGAAGCSVVMAASESKEPDLSVISYGNSRTEIERVFGTPIEHTREWGGDRATYQYFTNDEASYTRAGLYAVLDFFTGFVAEIFTTPIEGLQGDKHQIKVVYDLDGRLIQAERYMTRATLDKPERIIGIEGEAPDAVVAEEPGTSNSQDYVRGRYPG